MFELPKIVEAIEELVLDEHAGGQYASSTDYAGDCCYKD